MTETTNPHADLSYEQTEKLTGRPDYRLSDDKIEDGRRIATLRGYMDYAIDELEVLQRRVDARGNELGAEHPGVSSEQLQFIIGTLKMGLDVGE